MYTPLIYILGIYNKRKENGIEFILIEKLAIVYAYVNNKRNGNNNNA